MFKMIKSVLGLIIVASLLATILFPSGDNASNNGDIRLGTQARRDLIGQAETLYDAVRLAIPTVAMEEGIVRLDVNEHLGFIGMDIYADAPALSVSLTRGSRIRDVRDLIGNLQYWTGGNIETIDVHWFMPLINNLGETNYHRVIRLQYTQPVLTNVDFTGIIPEDQMLFFADTYFIHDALQ